MRTVSLTAFLLAIFSSSIAGSPLTRLARTRIAVVCVSGALRLVPPAAMITGLGVSMPRAVHAEGEVMKETTMSFNEFIPLVKGGGVQKVVFKGARPTYLMAYTKDGKIMVEDGFPAYDDPMGPSGPAQAIALCQHSPGVVVEQDLSDLLLKSKTSDKAGKYKPRAMLKSSGYPAEYDQSKK